MGTDSKGQQIKPDFQDFKEQLDILAVYYKNDNYKARQGTNEAIQPKPADQKEKMLKLLEEQEL